MPKNAKSSRLSGLSIGLLLVAAQVSALDLAIPSQLTNKLSVTILDATTKQSIYSYRESAPSRLASNMKILTSFVALDQLGSKFVWPTTLAYQGTIQESNLNGSVYLIGGGDPTLSSRVIYEMLAQLKSQGITKINGDFILDSSIFNSIPPNSELHPEPFAEYAVNPNGLLIDSNLSRLMLQIKNNKVAINPRQIGTIRLRNHLTLSKIRTSCSNSSDYLTLSQDTASSVTLTGSIPSSCNGQPIKLNLLGNQIFDSMIIRKALEEQQISVIGKIESGIAPSNSQIILRHQSAPLIDILPLMNKFSNNMMAKTLFLSLGAYRTTNQDTYRDARQLYRQTLLKQFDFNEVEPENGAGLSRNEKITSQHMVELLDKLYQSPHYAAFLASLPTPSESGTLQNSFPDYAKRLYAKTGTLDDSKAYSGYFMARNGHVYILAFIANNISKQGENSELSQFKNLFAASLKALDKQQ